MRLHSLTRDSERIRLRRLRTSRTQPARIVDPGGFYYWWLICSNMDDVIKVILGAVIGVVPAFYLTVRREKLERDRNHELDQRREEDRRLGLKKEIYLEAVSVLAKSRIKLLLMVETPVNKLMELLEPEATTAAMAKLSLVAPQGLAKEMMKLNGGFQISVSLLMPKRMSLQILQDELQKLSADEFAEAKKLGILGAVMQSKIDKVEEQKSKLSRECLEAAFMAEEQSFQFLRLIRSELDICFDSKASEKSIVDQHHLARDLLEQNDLRLQRWKDENN